jgi:tight adherence protein C
MMTAGDILLGAAVIALSLGMAGVVFQIASVPMLERPTLGIRGLKRAKALETSVAFAAVEPAVRLVGAWLQPLPLRRVRGAMRLSLTRAGGYLGLSDDELLAANALTGALLAGALALANGTLRSIPSILIPIGLGLGVALPWLRVRAIGQERARSVNRSLPGALELVAMCLSAGMDFPGSLRRIVGSAPDSREPIVEELARVLQELELGHTRRSALERLALRVPTEQVRELASAIVQAEQKGSPLAPVLTIQAQTQRLRRSIAAEQIASDAALMLMGPMALIFLCVIVLLLGPVVVRLMTGGLEIS